MNKKRPQILITNDDGYAAKGLRKLVTLMRTLGDVVLVSTDEVMSAKSHSCTIRERLYVRLVHEEEGFKEYRCNGTPVDCVKLALNQFCKERKPDLIIGGINHGDNSTVNSHYSGTMGVAFEGCMKYIPSIALSSCDYNTEADLSYLEESVVKIVTKVCQEGLPKGICLNVNFPKEYPFKGVRACRMTYGQWVNEIVEERHPRGYDYFWMVGEYRNDEPNAEDSDQWAVEHVYVAITPTTIDVTAHEFINKVKEWKL